MTTRRTQKTAKRRQRAHDILPAGFDYRDGRPRWLPSPTRRAQGWKIVELRGPAVRGVKTWMSRGDAITRCEAINAAVKAWVLKSQPVPAEMAPFAPEGSTDGTGRTPQQRLDRRSIGALADAWLESASFTLTREQGGLSESTKGDYKRKLNRLFEALVESDSEAKVAGLRALPIDILAAPEEDDEDGEFVLETAYHWLMTNAGHPMAHGVLQVASVWLTWCWKKRRIKSLSANPVNLIDRTPPTGRIRVARVEEIAALVAAAEVMPGHGFIADALLLALDLGWSLADILRLDWRRVVKRPGGQWFVTRNSRGKTGVAGSEIPFMAIGSARLERMVARNAAADVTSVWLISRGPSDKPMLPRLFNTYWNAVRDRAAVDQPSLKTGDMIEGSEYEGPFNFMDARDTFITMAREAEMTVEQTCSRSQHQPTRVHAVWQKHYGAITPRIAASGARKMDAHMLATGWVKALT